jgi:hypothetical protein
MPQNQQKLRSRERAWHDRGNRCREERFVGLVCSSQSLGSKALHSHLSEKPYTPKWFSVELETEDTTR